MKRASVTITGGVVILAGYTLIDPPYFGQCKRVFGITKGHFRYVGSGHFGDLISFLCIVTLDLGCGWVLWYKYVML